MEAKHLTDPTHFVEAVAMRKNMKLVAQSEVKISTSRNASTRSRSAREYSRRRGQTLLLAVLLMVFAALLGATFITVVALNLSQTSRGTNRTEAQQAAFAGARYANDRILDSVEGEKWRPFDDQQLPTAGAQFDAYYSAFEQAQGWTYDAANPDLAFVKFPNPLALNAALRNSPTFLLKVQRVTSGDRTGQLLIDSIGRSADDDAVFARVSPYKPTSENGGPGAFPRYDSNWDFGKNRVIQTTSTADSTPTADPAIVTVPVVETSGFTPGRLVLVNNGATRAATTVVSVSPATKEVTLRFAAAVTLPANSTLRAGSPLTGNIQSGKFDATGAGRDPITGDAIYVPASSTIATPQDVTGGMFINGGLALINQIRLLVNRDTANPQNNDNVRVAGIIARNDTSTAPIITQIVNKSNASDNAQIPANATPAAPGTIQEQVQDNSDSEAGDPTAAIVRPLTPGRIDSPASRWLKLTRNDAIDKGSQYGYRSGVYIDNVDDVEKVGRLIAGGTTPDFRPMTVAEMQRLWQRKSFPTRGGEAGNVDNGGTSGDPVSGYTQDTSALPNNPFHRLAWKRLASGAFTGDAYNFPLPAAPTPVPLSNPSTPTSLEERGIRGWVSPWEFKPRGVLIELQGNNIIMTRDDRSDVFDASSTVASVPNPQKAWRDPSGNLINNGKSYRMLLDTTTGQRYVLAPGEIPTTGPGGNAYGAAVPFNGVIYAEGNVRVRGYTGAKDVTIASMNNIYVEGSIYRPSPTSGSVALLAKNNVVLNPTRFLAAPEGMAEDGNTATYNVQADAAANSTSVTIDNGAGWKVGDLLYFNNDKNSLYTVRSVTPSGANTILTLSSGLNKAVSMADATIPRVADTARHFADTRVDNPMVLAGEYSHQLGANDFLLRNVRFDGKAPNGTYNLTFRHGAAKTEAFNLVRNLTSTDGNISLKVDANSNNLIEAGAGVADTENKLILDSTTPYDLLFPDTGAMRGDDTTQTLDKLSLQVTPIPAPTPPSPWTLTATIPNLAARRVAAFRTILPVTVGSTTSVPQTLSAVLRPYGTWNVGTTLDLAPPTAGNYRYFGGGFQSTTPLPRDEIYSINPVRPGATFSDAAGNTDPLDLLFYQKDVTGANRSQPSWFSFPLGTLPTADSLPVFWHTDTVTPAYGLGPMKLEANNGGNGFLDATNKFTPGMNIEVDAQIYAQNGSWFVIPMPTLEPKVDAVALAAIDADVTLNPAQIAAKKTALSAASTRFRRLNYDIAVRGTISQNFAPPLNDYDTEVDPDGVATGPQQRWIDSLAFPTQVAASGTDKYGTNWTTIRYIGDKPPAGNNLKMPISPDLLYIG